VQPDAYCDGRPTEPPGGWPGGVPPRLGRTPFDAASDDLRKLWWEQIAWPRLAARSGSAVAHVPYFAPPVARAGRARVVTTIHDVIPLIIPEYATSPLVRLYNALVGAGARRADVVLVDSEASRRDVIRLLRVPPEHIRVIYLAADETVGVPVPDDELQRVRAKYGLNDPFVLYLGGFDKRKNVPALLRALAALPADRTWQLAIGGRLPTHHSPLFPDLPRLAADLGVAERVRFLGYVPAKEKPALYQAATCFAFPSLYEGFGLDPLEALAAGTPVICSNRSSLPELMGDAAILVDPDDTAEFAAGIERVLTDAALRADLAARGRAQSATFTWEATARQTAAAYRAASAGTAVAAVGGRR
jgi:glycosyltransferase involved in cell wall biosynthesis